MRPRALHHTITVLVLATLAVAWNPPACLVHAAPPTAEDDSIPIDVRSKADVLQLKDPTHVRARGLDPEELGLLLDHPKLRYLIVESCDLSEAGLWSRLGHLKQLAFLRITDYEKEETTKWATFLQDLKDSPVERIEMHRVYDVTQEWLLRFADIASLKQLEIPGVAEERPTQPPEVPRWKLESLRIRNDCSSSGLDSAWLAFLGKQPKLASLHLSQAKLDDAGCRGLAASRSIRALGLHLCDFEGDTVPDSFKFATGLDGLEVGYSLDDKPLAKLISLNVPKAVSITCRITLTGQFFSDVADWSQLTELTVFEHSDSRWNNEYIISAIARMPSLQKVVLQGTRLTDDTVVEALLARRPKAVTLWDAEALSAGVIEALVASTFIESLIVDGLTTITTDAVRKHYTRFYALRKNVPDAKCELNVKESH